MTIKQALKYKNKLVSKMNIEFNKAHQYNSVEEGGQRHTLPAMHFQNILN